MLMFPHFGGCAVHLTCELALFDLDGTFGERDEIDDEEVDEGNRECTHTQRERERATVRSAMDEGHGEGEGEGETSFLLAGLGTQKPTVI
jgi:hypothetical protein